jgi:FkbM family methyltransferase
MRAPAWCGYWQRLLSTGAEWVDSETLRVAVRAARPDGTAIDGGAHVGSWVPRLAAAFPRVIAFEPCPENFALLQANTQGLRGVELRQAALGATAGEARLQRVPEPGANSGQWAIAEAGEPVCVETVDGLGLADLSLLKLDLEGYELPALTGARETLRRCRPVVVLEEAGWGRLHGIPDRAATAFLIGLGFRPFHWSGQDVVFMPSEDLAKCG